jgi:rhomboid protease GluP
MRRFEPLTVLLIGLCVALTLWAKWSEATPSGAGAVSELALWRGEYWRLVTHLLLHDPVGWLHLAVNMLSLYFIGRIVAQVTGRRIYLLSLLLAAMTGLALSVGLQPGPAPSRFWRVGISGGIAGLLGLLLAVEWAVSRSFLQFLKQRNTIIILIIVVVSTALAMIYERAAEGVSIDHAAHGGGFGFGFLFGVAYYSRKRRRRPRLAAAVALVLGVLPIAYICYPALNPTFFVWQGDRAWREDRREDAAACYERALSLDADHVIAAARLALVRDDPAPLEGLSAPGNAAESASLLNAYLTLSRRRFERDPDTARALFERARLLPGSAKAWARFAEAAEAAGWIEEACAGFTLAAKWARAGRRKSPEWPYRIRALRLFMKRPVWQAELQAHQRLVLADKAADHALGAAGGLAEGRPRADREAIEVAIADAAFKLDAWTARIVGGPEDDRRLLYSRLRDLFNVLAENAADPKRKPLYRWRRAQWGWRAAGAVDSTVRGFFKAALTEAHLYGNPEVQALAEQWFRAQGLPIPPLDLAEGEDGG